MSQNPAFLEVPDNVVYLVTPEIASLLARLERELSAAERECADAQALVAQQADEINELQTAHTQAVKGGVDLATSVTKLLADIIGIGTVEGLPEMDISEMFEFLSDRFPIEGGSLASLEVTLHDALGFLQGQPIAKLWDGVEALIEREQFLRNEVADLNYLIESLTEEPSE